MTSDNKDSHRRIGLISSPLPRSLHNRFGIKSEVLHHPVFSYIAKNDCYVYITLERPGGLWIAAWLLKRRKPFFVVTEKGLKKSKKQIFYEKKAAGVIYPTSYWRKEATQQEAIFSTNYVPDSADYNSNLAVKLLARNLQLQYLSDETYHFGMGDAQSRYLKSKPRTARLIHAVMPTMIRVSYNLYNPIRCRKLRETRDLKRCSNLLETAKEKARRNGIWWELPNTEDIPF